MSCRYAIPVTRSPWQIFTGKKMEDISPSTHNMDVPNVRRTEYQVLDIQDVSDARSTFMPVPSNRLTVSIRLRLLDPL
jgi:hypothetical protein